MSTSPLVAIDARLLSSQNTGDTTHWRGIVGGLLRLENGPRLLLLSNTPAPSEVPAEWRESWVHVPGRSRWWSLVSFPLAARKLGAQVVHTQYNLSPLVGRNGVTTVHDVSFLVGPQWFRPLDRFLLRSQVPASMKRAVRVVTVSETSRAEIERFVPEVAGKVRVVLNALGDNVVPSPRDQAARRVHAELGVQGPFVLTLGTRWPRKNMALAVNAVAGLGHRLPHRLVVAGKAGWGDIPHNDRTLFAGYVSDSMLGYLYSAADAYLAPSLHEGFGITVLEAFACGCPVLCSGGGALPEVAGEAGVVAPDFLASTWTGLLGSILGDSGKLDAMRQAGHRRVRDFDWVKSAQVLTETYREVAR